MAVLTGIISGLIEPLMIATIAFVYALIFPSADSPKLSATLNWAPVLQDWLAAARQALTTGISAHPAAVVALVGTIPAVIFLRGFFSYLNVYFLQWTAVRAITDLRVRLFEHLMNQSASFFNRTNTGELMSRILNDTNALQNVISATTSNLVKDPVTVASLLAYMLWQQPGLTLV